MGVTAGVPSRFENELTLTSRRAFDRLPFHDALRGRIRERRAGPIAWL